MAYCNYRTIISMSVIAPLIGIIGFGLSHGINPSHGWPVALLAADEIVGSKLNL